MLHNQEVNQSKIGKGQWKTLALVLSKKCTIVMYVGS